MSTKATASRTASPLATLRAAVSLRHPTNLTAAMHIGHQQAELLHKILNTHGKDLLERITCLPGITVTAINNLPVASTAFWGNGHWNIHIREQDLPERQRFNALHQLKHIIDHPGRRATRADDVRLSDEDEELVADHFANCFLIGEAI